MIQVLTESATILASPMIPYSGHSPVPLPKVATTCQAVSSSKIFSSSNQHI